MRVGGKGFRQHSSSSMSPKTTDLRSATDTFRVRDELDIVQDGEKISVKEMVFRHHKRGVLREGIPRRHKRVSLFGTFALGRNRSRT